MEITLQEQEGKIGAKRLKNGKTEDERIYNSCKCDSCEFIKNAVDPTCQHFHSKFEW